MPVRKRLPSSSMNEASQTGLAGSTPLSAESEWPREPARTPSAPSKRPPRGTVSRWEPRRTAVPVPASHRPRTLPAASISASRPSVRSSRRASRSPPPARGDHAKRVTLVPDRRTGRPPRGQPRSAPFSAAAPGGRVGAAAAGSVGRLAAARASSTSGSPRARRRPRTRSRARAGSRRAGCPRTPCRRRSRSRPE